MSGLTKRPRWLLCIDLECTCDDDPNLVPRKDMEVVELPWVVVDTALGSITHSARRLVKPTYSTLTSQCTQLTGITQSSLSSAGNLADALGALEVDIHDILAKSRSSEKKAVDGAESNLDKGDVDDVLLDEVVAVTHGTWDLGTQLRLESARKALSLPPYLRRFFDIRKEVSRFVGGSLPAGGTRLSALCKAVGAEVHGREHSGIDDSTSVANVVCKIVRETGFADATSDVFCHSTVIDLAALLAVFESEESCVVRVTGLPFTATFHDIKSWCQAVGVVPERAEMITEPGRSGQPMPSGEGFVFCETHGGARKLLDNTALVGTRWVEVFPATQSEVTSAHTQPLIEDTAPSDKPEKSEKREKPMREGDWICTSCDDLQFARNFSCRRCRAPKPGSNAAASEGGGGEGRRRFDGPPPPRSGPRLREGDWICPNCGDHQFARNEACRNCRAARTAAATVPPGYAPPPAGPPVFGGAARTLREGDWLCPACGDHQFARNASCRKCKAPRPPSADGVPGGGGMPGPYGGSQLPPYVPRSYGSSYPPPPMTTYGGRDGSYAYGGGGYSVYGSGGAYPPSQSYGGPRGNAPFSGGASFGGGGRPGDWNCPSCGDLQFARNATCRKCKTPHP